QVDHVALDGKFLEFLHHSHEMLLLLVSVVLVPVRCCCATRKNIINAGPVCESVPQALLETKYEQIRK
ncbi:MAG: hypothetical protein O9327_00540, partial [Polaromonas sp.]|nr:hypothetical protein [Polaromonas sp.]